MQFLRTRTEPVVNLLATDSLPKPVFWLLAFMGSGMTINLYGKLPLPVMYVLLGPVGLLVLQAIWWWVVLRAWRQRKALEPTLATVVELLPPGPATPHTLRLPTTQGTLELYNPFRGALITGGAGAGKSYSLIEPIIAQAVEQDFAGLVYDFKFPTLAQHVAACLRDNERLPAFYINFQDLTRSHRVNPLHPDLFPSVSHAKQLSKLLVHNLTASKNADSDFWLRSAIGLIAASMWFLRVKHPQYCTLPHALNLLFHEPAEFVPALRSDPQAGDLVASLAGAVKGDAKAQISGVMGSTQDAMSEINTPEICYVLSGHDFTLDVNDPKDPKWVVLGNDPNLSNVYSPVLALLVQVATSRMNQAKKAPSVVVLDEAPTLFLPNFSKLPSTCRSNKVSTVFCIQDFSQMYAKYGQDESKAIVGNLNSQFFGKTSNPDTGRYVAEYFGKHDVTYVTNSQSSEAAGLIIADLLKTRSQAESIQQRDRVSGYDVSDLPTGSFYARTVESNHDDKTLPLLTFTPPRRAEAPELEPVSTVTPEQVQAHFRRIKSEVAEVLALYSASVPAELPPPAQAPTPRRSTPTEF